MQDLQLACKCGATAMRTRGAAIMSTECLCSDCQRAGALLQRLPGAPAMLDANGATRCEMYRKDRVACLRGSEHLREHRLRPDSATRRVVAACCNTPMFLEFTKGHWIDL